MIEIRVLGHFSVRRGDEEVRNERFGGRLPRRLVRVLATRFDEVVARDVLIEALWPSRAPADPDGNLNVLVNRARRALSDPDVIETATGGYRLVADRCWLDIDEFGRLLTQGRVDVDDGHPATGLRHLRAALELWGEPFAEDAYEEFVQSVRRTLFGDHQTVLETAADAALLTHQPTQAASLARRAVAEQPLRERAHLLLARALAASGDRAGALATLRTLRRTLGDELGIEPSAEFVDIEFQVLEGRPSHRAIDQPDRRATLATPFVGRRSELEQLVSLSAGARRVAVIEGPAGSGKSRLLDEVAQDVEVPRLSARAFLPESTTPWALARTLLDEALGHDVGAAEQLPASSRQALSQLAMPDLMVSLTSTDGSAPVQLEEETMRALALEGAVRLIRSVSVDGALLVVDDLQWADPTSLALLALAVARLDQLLVVVAHRPLDPRSDAANFLADLRQLVRPIHVELGRLSVDEIADLTDNHELAVVLDAETDGTPFAIHEVLQQLSDQRTRGTAGDYSSDEAVAIDEARRIAREGHRRSLLARIDQRTSPARHLVRLMAVLGREAPATLLATASGRAQRSVMNDLDSLARAGLVRLGDRGWATAHDLITETVIDSVDRAELGTLHLCLADALGDDTSEPDERGVHLRGAGDEPAAAAAFADAARGQLDRHAHPEAERLTNLGLEIARDRTVWSRLLAVRAEARAHRGDLQGARDDLREALTVTHGGPERSLLLTRSAGLAMATDDLAQAAQLVDLALVDAADDERARARALALGSIIDMNGTDERRAERRAAESLELYERLGDAAGVADILDARAMATFLDGEIRKGVADFDRVAQLFTDSGNLLRVVTPRSTRGHGLVFLDDPVSGLDDTEQALELARTLGHPEGQTYALWHRSEAQVAVGHLSDARDSARSALDIAERLEHHGWTATAWRATGLANEAAGDDNAALHAYQRSLDAGRSVPLFTCWAHARLALTLLRLDELDAADDHARHAIAHGPPLGHYEARLAQAAIAVRRDDHDAEHLVTQARQRALDGGHLVSARLLSEL